MDFSVETLYTLRDQASPRTIYADIMSDSPAQRKCGIRALQQSRSKWNRNLPVNIYIELSHSSIAHPCFPHEVDLVQLIMWPHADKPGPAAAPDKSNAPTVTEVPDVAWNR